MIKLTASINGKQVMELGLLNFVESRLIHPLKEGDKVEFVVEDTIVPLRTVYVEEKHFKINPKS